MLGVESLLQNRAVSRKPDRPLPLAKGRRVSGRQMVPPRGRQAVTFSLACNFLTNGGVTRNLAIESRISAGLKPGTSSVPMLQQTIELLVRHAGTDGLRLFEVFLRGTGSLWNC
jgi:hypothetical protein